MKSRTLTAKRCKGADLGVLQEDAEAAARVLKGAKTALANAEQAVKKAEESYNVAQKALTAGVAQVQAATKVG